MDCWAQAKAAGTITHSMADSRAANWRQHLAPFQGKVQSALEIGSYEGQSAMFWLDFFPGVALTCIDPWAYYTTGTLSAIEVEDHFDTNVGKRVTKIKGNSIPSLYALYGHKFDLIYIDGDHRRDSVMIDSLMAWPLLNPGGVMIWDDYATFDPEGKPHRRPEIAVDTFIAMKVDELSILANTQEQMMVVKADGR